MRFLPPNQGSRRRRIAGLLTAIYLLLIFVLSSIPGNRLSIPSGMDYLAHILEFAILAFLSAYAVFVRYEAFYPYAVLCFSIAVGIVNEIYQVAIPLREPSVMDVMSDGIGAFMGIWIFAMLFEREWIDGIRNKVF